MEKCIKCEKELSYPEKGLCKKLFGTETENFFCIDCLAEYYNVSRESLEEKIKYYRATGCPLF